MEKMTAWITLSEFVLVNRRIMRAYSVLSLLIFDSLVSFFARGVHKGNTKLSLVELWTTLLCAVFY